MSVCVGGCGWVWVLNIPPRGDGCVLNIPPRGIITNT